MRFIPSFPTRRLRFKGRVTAANAFNVDRAHLLPVVRSDFINDALHLQPSCPSEISPSSLNDSAPKNTCFTSGCLGCKKLFLYHTPLSPLPPPPPRSLRTA